MRDETELLRSLVSGLSADDLERVRDLLNQPFAQFDAPIDGATGAPPRRRAPARE